MSSVTHRLLSTLSVLQHGNPLGLPSKVSSPTLAKRMQKSLPIQNRISGVKKTIAVSSAKGGVGKSTIAANLALAFARHGYRCGILDTDIFGPSIPTLFNLADADEPHLSHDNRLLPLTNYGVSTMSIGYLIPQDAAIVWRGLMVAKALQQLLHDVSWGELDVLVLDLPPGTGDVQLTIAQQVVLDGVVLVSTPQNLSLVDTFRGLQMFRQVLVPVLGVVQNMSSFVCPSCNATHRVFDHNDGNDVQRFKPLLTRCAEQGLEILGELPLNSSICRDADRGVPTVVSDPDGIAAQKISQIAKNLAIKVGL